MGRLRHRLIDVATRSTGAGRTVRTVRAVRSTRLTRWLTESTRRRARPIVDDGAPQTSDLQRRRRVERTDRGRGDRAVAILGGRGLDHALPRRRTRPPAPHHLSRRRRPRWAPRSGGRPDLDGTRRRHTPRRRSARTSGDRLRLARRGRRLGDGPHRAAPSDALGASVPRRHVPAVGGTLPRREHAGGELAPALDLRRRMRCGRHRAVDHDRTHRRLTTRRRRRDPHGAGREGRTRAVPRRTRPAPRRTRPERPGRGRRVRAPGTERSTTTPDGVRGCPTSRPAPCR